MDHIANGVTKSRTLLSTTFTFTSECGGKSQNKDDDEKEEARTRRKKMEQI